jgi:hypothetical protein
VWQRRSDWESNINTAEIEGRRKRRNSQVLKKKDERKNPTSKEGGVGLNRGCKDGRGSVPTWLAVSVDKEELDATYQQQETTVGVRPGPRLEAVFKLCETGAVELLCLEETEDRGGHPMKLCRGEKLKKLSCPCYLKYHAFLRQ